MEEKEFLSPEWLEEHNIVEEKMTYTCKSKNPEIIKNAISQLMIIAGAYINWMIQNDSIGFNYGALKEYRLGWSQVRDLLVTAIKEKVKDQEVEYVAILNVAYFNTSSLCVVVNGATELTVYEVWQDIGSSETGLSRVEKSIADGLAFLKRVRF
ncbi:MAG: hypothetical protein WA064_04570 [Candidatus Moraniibacteriota bacterium]